MKASEFKKEFKAGLKEIYPDGEINSIFEWLLQDFMGISRIDLILKPEIEFDSEQINRLQTALERLKKSEPIQYVLGKTEFFGIEFKVDKNVLIPRPETEELVQWIIEENQHDKLKVLDIGTGSGCIAVSLAKNMPEAEVYAVDISEKALEVARENAMANKVEVDFKLMDILNPDKWEGSLDVIVSNPPYVRLLEKEQMAPNVLEYEPHTALFVADEDALLFYRKILEFGLDNLSKNGSIYFEINEFLAEDLKQLFLNYNLKDFTLKKDIFGKFRMARVRI